MAFSNPALEKRLQTIGGSKPKITGSLVKTTPTPAPKPQVTGFSNPALEKRIQTIVTTPVKKVATTPVKVVSAPKKQPTLLDNASAFLAKIPAPAGIPQAVFGAVKGLDFERLKSAITAGAKTIPGTTKIAGGIIAENWAKQQKQMNSFFGILPKEFEPLFGNKLANMVTEPAANKANIVAPKLREQGQISQKKAVEPYAKLGPAKGNTQKIAEAIAFNLPQMALSTGLTVATSLLTKNPQLATAVGMSTSYGMGASEIYNTARENGLTDKQALPYATMGGAVVGALDFVPLNRLIGKTTGASKVIEQSIIKKITSEIFSVGTQAGFEGITEGLQEIVGNAIEGTYKEHTDLFKGVALSTVVGALLGGGTDVALTTALHIGGKGESIEEVSNQVNQKIETALNKPESKRTAEEKLIVENVLTTQVSPDEALDIVTTSKLENTDQGKEIVKSVLQAKNEGQDIKITTDEGHDIVKVELVSPNYIRPVTIPEDIPQDSRNYETGKPVKIKAYHGTDGNFDTFNKEHIGKNTDSGMFGSGFYFTDDLAEAKTYARKTGNVKEVELDFKKPYVINSEKDIPKIDVPNATLDDLKNGASNYSKAFTKYLQDRGYDGVIDNISPRKQYIAFEPSSIKISQGKKEIKLYRGGKEDAPYTSTHKHIAEDYAKQRGGIVKEFILKSDAKVIDYLDIPNAKYKDLNDYNIIDKAPNQDILSFMNNEVEKEYSRATKWAKDNGYDAIKFPTEGEVRIINPELTQSESSKKKVTVKTQEQIKQEMQEPTGSRKNIVSTKESKAIKDNLVSKFLEVGQTSEDATDYKKNIQEAINNALEKAKNDKVVLSAIRAAIGDELIRISGASPTESYKAQYAQIRQAATDEFMGPAIKFMEQVKADIDEKLITAREVPAVVEKIKDGSKVVVKLANETPIGTNIQKDSRLYKRISDVAEGAIKEELDSRSVTYNTLDLEKQKKIVADLITENPEKAIDMAKGLINTPEGVTRNAISMGLYEAAREADTNLSANLLTDTSLRSTRAGHEIVSLRGDATANPSLTAARKVISSRIDSVVKRYNDVIKGLGVAEDAPAIKKLDALVKHEAQKVKKIVTEQQKRIQSAQDIINQLTCK